MPKQDLIKCGNHSYAPWHIVCIHLIEGTSDEWTLIPLAEDDPREVEGDWLCAECAEEHDAGIRSIDKIKAVCMHCVRKLRGVK